MFVGSVATTIGLGERAGTYGEHEDERELAEGRGREAKRWRATREGTSCSPLFIALLNGIEWIRERVCKLLI